MDELLTTILLACLGSSGFFALAQFLLSRVFKKKDDRDGVMKSLKTLQEYAHTSELNDSKTQLLILVNHFPKDHQAILMESERYFGELGGDSWIYNIIYEWAEKEGVNIDYLSELHANNLKKLGK